MATIGRALRQVKSQLDQFIRGPDIEHLCLQNRHDFRKRKLGGPAGTVHLMLLQLLAAVSMAGLRHVSKVGVTKQAIGKARKALPLGVWFALVGRVCPPGPALSMWHGLRVMMADAMSFVTEDTPALAGKYGKARNGKPSADHGRPTPKLLALVDLAGGFVHQVIALPWARQERVCLARLLKACGEAALLLGDRGMAGFAQLALMGKAKVEGCLRLPRWLVVFGAGRANHRRLRPLGKQDMLVSWRKGGRRVGWMSKLRWGRLPERLTLRQISFRITRKGFRTHWAWIITTLTDPTVHPAQELVELYGKRWQIEVCFRDLKRTLGLRRTAARDKEGVQKELLAFLVLYNLVRQVMAAAAARQNEEPDRISFVDALRWLLWSEPGEELIDLIVNLKPPRDTQPRMLKHGRRKYARLNKPRDRLTKPPSQAKL
jgi:DDE family transposase